MTTCASGVVVSISSVSSKLGFGSIAAKFAGEVCDVKTLDQNVTPPPIGDDTARRISGAIRGDGSGEEP
jgi:hypothetical protein